MSEAQNTPETKEENPPAEPKGRWCLVANVTTEYLYANRPAGAWHLPEGAKVYVNRAIWGDGWYSAQILCKDRRTHRWFKTIVKVHWLHHFRAVVEYSPSLQRRLDAEDFLGGYDENGADACRWYVEYGNQQAVDWETERIVRRHEPTLNRRERVSTE